MVPDREDSLIGQVRAQATPAACRRFAWTLLGGLPAAGSAWLILLRFMRGEWNWQLVCGFAFAGILLGGAALVSPTWGRPIYVGWHVATRTIERLLTWVVLALVFWLVITPVALARRGRASPFSARREDRRKSHWQEVIPVKDPSRYYRQF